LDVLLAIVSGIQTSGASPPVFQPKEYYVQAALIRGEQAGRIQQLLKHLVVGTKFDDAGDIQLVHPKIQRLRQWLSRERGCQGDSQDVFVFVVSWTSL
jgi:hypothetical protein